MISKAIGHVISDHLAVFVQQTILLVRGRGRDRIEDRLTIRRLR
ncbi:MAG TPA: hypothetical protein VME22_23760 [Solirubrobacteraceae bacterium]|nr:hypothetical protein [Solirubrobacteraceae bacterium]